MYKPSTASKTREIESGGSLEEKRRKSTTSQQVEKTSEPAKSLEIPQRRSKRARDGRSAAMWENHVKNCLSRGSEGARLVKLR